MIHSLALLLIGASLGVLWGWFLGFRIGHTRGEDDERRAWTFSEKLRGMSEDAIRSQLYDQDDR